MSSNQPPAGANLQRRRMGVSVAVEETTSQSPTLDEAAPARRRMSACTAPKVEAALQDMTSEPVRAGMSSSEATSTVPSSGRLRMRTSQTVISADQLLESPKANQQKSSAPDDADDGHTTSKLRRLMLTLAGVVAIALVVVLAAKWLRSTEVVSEFISDYSGHARQISETPTGTPSWLGWQHFFNMFLMVLIVRTGLQVRNERKPPAYWKATSGTFFAPKRNTPKKVSLTQWLHQSLDVLWVVNGLVFIVLLFASGQWKRIVPGGWDVFPHMLSGLVQYASLDWPLENGWIHYNALQVVAYSLTIFVAAPLAVLSGIRFSTWWPEPAAKLNKIYPVEWARAIHFPVMLYFVGFTVIHVFLVFFTGALRNLNHMYTARDEADFWGLVIFLGSCALIGVGWFLTAPLFTTPVAARLGTVSK